MNKMPRMPRLIASLKRYITHLDDEGPQPITSTSHLTLRSLYGWYGEEIVDYYLKKYWNLRYRKNPCNT